MVLFEPPEDKLSRIAEDVSYIKAQITVIADHETRIRSLERWKLGGTTIVTFLAGIIGFSHTP